MEEKARFDERAKQVLRPSTAVQKYTAKKKRQQELDESVAPMTYNHPFTYESLHLSPTRYACNKMHKVPAMGIVPGCSKFWHDLS